MNRKRLLFSALLFLYSVALFRIMVLREVPVIRIGRLMLNFGGADANGNANFVPLRTIGPYLLGYKGWIIAGINLAGNVGLPMPAGFLLLLVWPGMTWKRATCISFAAGLAIETLQELLHLGIFDIDDVILNGLGVLIGYAIIRGLMSWYSSRVAHP